MGYYTEALDAERKRLILQALHSAFLDVRKTARILGISERTLYRDMQRLGITRDDARANNYDKNVVKS